MPEPRPAVTPAGEYAYAQFPERMAAHDEQGSWLLLRLVAALAAGDQPIRALVENPGIVEALDPATVDPVWLPFLAQVAGARLAGGMSLTRQRAEVQNPSGRMRGRPAHLVAVARPRMAEPARVQIRERYDPAIGAGTDSPGHLQVRVRASDVLPGQAPALERELVDSVPAHLVGHVALTNDRDWDDVAATYSDWAAVEAGNTDWDDLLSA